MDVGEGSRDVSTYSMTDSGASLSGAALDLQAGQVWLALVPVLAMVVGVVGFSLIDLVRRPAVAYLPKPAWALIIAFVAVPLGAIVYLIAGRHPKTSQEPSGAPPRTPTNASVTATRTASPTQLDAVSPHTRDRPAAVIPASTFVVRTTGLTRDYGGKGLFDIDLAVPRGSIYGLVGPNGSGKTTLLSILGGTRRADRGRVGIDLPRQQVAVCSDVPEFDEWLTATEVVQLAAAMINVDWSTGATISALTAAGLADDRDRRVGDLSRGMVQRLGLACALIGEPQLLILDEPTSALDPAGRADVLGLVSNMRGQRTVIFSSHILADVQRVADRVGVLRHGRLLYQGRTRDLVDERLRPCWLVRVAGDPSAFRHRLEGESWVTRIVPVGPDAVRIEAASLEEGELGIPVVLAAEGLRLVSCEPVAADLETAFLALTAT